MTLDEAQKQKVATWIAEGMKLAEIQKRLDTELGLRLTYMEVRLLVDDLKLTPKDPEPPKQEKPLPPPAPARGQTAPTEEEEEPFPEPAAPGGGKANVSVDAVTRPGTLVSGSVTFSDGQSAAWHLDQLGRLGLVPKQQGYRPSAADVQAFQVELQTELQKLGF